VTTTNVSVTIDDDILKAVHAMRGDVSLSRFLSNLAYNEAVEQGIIKPSQQKVMLVESMLE
jgi:hypothetical protein